MKKTIFIFLLLFTSGIGLSQGFQENFDNPGIAAPTGAVWVLPNSGTWHIFDNGVGTQNWTVSTESAYPAHSDPRAVYINRENIGQGNTSKEYLATPLITFPANPQLRFQTRTTLITENGTVFEVRAASASADPTLPESYTTLVASWTEEQLTAQYNVYEEKVVDLTLPEPQMYLAFVRVFTQTGTGIAGDRWLIDDVQITGECLNPTNLVAVSSTNSAVLTWSGASASQWNIHVLPSGVPLTDASVGTPLLVNTPNANEGFTVTQTTLSTPTVLQSGTQYVFWIQSDCGYDKSEWVSSDAFYTQLLPAVCGGNYVDPGGISDTYPYDMDEVTTICPDNPGDMVTALFTMFATEPGFDRLYVYDGDSVNAPKIMSSNNGGWGNMTEPGGYWGSELPGPFTATNASGCLTFRFVSGGSGTSPGYLANISCDPAPACQKPTAVTSFPTTTLTTATLGWTAVGVATDWLVYAYPCNSPVPIPGSPGGILTSATTLTIENLEPGTCYAIAIYAVCGGATYSEPVIRTAATKPPVPVCGGIFMDPAGPLDYGPNENYSVTICPDEPNSRAIVAFLEFNIQPFLDGMYVYDGASAAAPQFGVYSGADIPGPFIATSESGCLTFYFISNASVNAPGWLANVTCEPAPACKQPFAMTVSNPFDQPSPTKAKIGWTNVGTATSWEVIAVACGSPIPTAEDTGISTTSNPFIYEGLNPDTCYDFYVRANCSSTGDGVSNWTGPKSLTTEPAPPSCGEIFTDEGGLDGEYPQVSTKIVTIHPDTIGDIITVYFSEFNVNSGGAGADYLFVYDGPLTSSPQIMNPGAAQGAFTGTTLPSPLEATNPEGCLTFKFVSTNGYGWGDTNASGWKADVVCTPAPTCSKPIDLEVLDVALNSVTVNWTETGNANEWQVLVLPDDLPFPSPTATGWQTATVHPFTYQGLIPGKRYKAYVRATCSDGTRSTWSYYASFSTPIANDDCAGATEVPVNTDPYCGQYVDVITDGALISGFVMGDYPCNNQENFPDVWFKFTALFSEHYVKINKLGNGVIESYAPFFSLLSGNCEGGLTYIGCATGDHLIATGLTPGETYYIQVMIQNAVQNVRVCIGTPPPILSTSDTYTNEELVHDVLFGETCAIITNISSATGTAVGSVNGIGYFNKNGAAFPFKEGVILSTGNFANAPGPNLSDLADGQEPTIADTPLPLWGGDTDLEAIVLEGTGNPMFSFNATKLEFDFVPVAPTISFDFIFASDEYGLYQCNYSDSFAFILTDLDAPDAAPVNLAVLPNTSIPISVVTIRNTIFNIECSSANESYFGNYYGQFHQNSWWYIPESTPPMAAPINFFGTTIPLTASSEVIPGHNYHIKLVIADRGDAFMDSAVFLEAGSFNFGGVELGSDLLIADGTAVCGEIFTLQTGLSESDYTFEWYLDGEPLEEEDGASLNVNTNGSYSVSALLNNSECVVHDSITVEFYAPGILAPIQDIAACNVYTFPVPEVGHFYLQPNGQGDIMDGATTAALGTQTVYLFYSSGPDCTEEEIFTLTISEVEEVSLPNVTSCGPYLLVELPVSSSYNTAEDGTGTTLSAGEMLSNTQTVYIITQGANCFTSTPFTITINELPELQPIADKSYCNSFTFPTPEIGHYYTQPNGQGTVLDNSTLTAIGPHVIYLYHSTGVDCSAEESFTVTIVEQEIATLPAVTVCNAYLLPSLPEFSFYSTTADGSGNTLPSGTSINTSQTIYICTQTENCFGSYPFSINIVPPPALGLVENVTACGSYELPPLAVGSYFSAPGGVAPLSGTITTLGVNTVYIYALTDVLEGCFSETSFTVTIEENRTLEEMDDVYSCGVYTLPSIAGVAYYAQPGATGGTLTTITHTQIVYAYAQGATPECAAEVSFTVHISEAPQLQISGACQGSAYLLEATINNFDPEAVYSYNWSTTDGNIVSAADNTSVTIKGEGAYYLKVTLNNCEGSAEEIVASTSCIIQKGISPNNDGKNDFFDLEGWDAKELQIFNRYGLKVYSRQHYTNQWYGQADNGDELPDGTYFYVLEFKTSRNPLTGWIFIIR